MILKNNSNPNINESNPKPTRPGPEWGVAPPRVVQIFFMIFMLLNISSLWYGVVNRVSRGLLVSRDPGLGGSKGLFEDLQWKSRFHVINIISYLEK